MARNKKEEKTLTPLGLFLAKKSANRAEISRKTGISTTRLNRLVNDANSNLRADELYLISLAIEAEPAVMQKELLGHLKIKSN